LFVGGWRDSARRVRAAISPEATGSPACGSGAGYRGCGLVRTARGAAPPRLAGGTGGRDRPLGWAERTRDPPPGGTGPTPGRTAGSWPEESRRAASEGEPALSGAPPAGQKEGLHAVKQEEAGPRGKIKPRSEIERGKSGQSPGQKIWWCGAPPEGAASFHLARPLSNGTPRKAIPRKWDIRTGFRGQKPRRMS
jgi:hypothetical protein